MAIATLDALIAGLQPAVEFIKAPTPTMSVGVPMSLVYQAGIPGAAAAPSAGVAGEALTAMSGQLQLPTPSGGKSAYLARLSATATVAGQLWLCDRLWQNSGLSRSVVTAQTVNSVEWPARDIDGTTNGKCVYIALEIGATKTYSQLPTVTLGYTNAAGVSGRSAANTISLVANAEPGSFFPIGLQSGDVGVRSVQTFQLSAAMSTGVLHLVAYRVLARLDLPFGGAGNSIDAVTGGLPKIPAGAVPFLVFVPAATTASTIQGHLVMSHG